jgi:hypothetical protein
MAESVAGNENGISVALVKGEAAAAKNENK